MKLDTGCLYQNYLVALHKERRMNKLLQMHRKQFVGMRKENIYCLTKTSEGGKKWKNRGNNHQQRERTCVTLIRVEVQGLITYRVRVENRNRTSREVLDATDRLQDVDYCVVDTMPRGTGNEARVVFFKPNPEEYTIPGWINDDDIEKALDRRGLIAAPPDDIAAVDSVDCLFGKLFSLFLYLIKYH